MGAAAVGLRHRRAAALAKDAADAKKYLNRVVADHKGTPWAMDAEQELSEPFGWEWHETFTDVAGPLAKAEAKKSPAAGTAGAATQTAPRSAAAVARLRAER